MDKLEQLKNDIQNILRVSESAVSEFPLVRTERQIGYEEGLQIVMEMIDELNGEQL